MIRTFLLVIAYILIQPFEVIKLYKDNKIRELILYFSVLSLALVINIMIIRAFKFISLAKLINIILGLD